ncbi:MAG: hypothetical protein U5R49_17915 [Deltaproteobacteria bacterium]|nr:hypothetical protein [Deltaproteobacteria bacterium]
MARKRSNIGQMLVESLTQEQVADLLTVISSSIDLNLYLEKFEAVDSDMVAVVKQILAPGSDSGRKGKAKPPVSLKRVMEQWELLWADFYDVISDLGDEEGAYAFQEHHWEAPYFDGWTLANDLEPIAEKMFTIMDQVHEGEDDPDLFQRALGEIGDGILSYPDWMGAEDGEPCILETKMTQCVLTWLWMGAKGKNDEGRVFAEKVLDLDDDLKMVELDPKALARFFVDLPDAVCREVYEFLKEGDPRVDVEDTYSAWHHIQHMYEAKFDSNKYLESCKKHLPDNWRYGLPLVEDAILHNDNVSAESLLIQTFSSYLGGREKRTWLPESSLLLVERSNFFHEGEEEIGTLLMHWAAVARKLKNKGRAAAAQFQTTTFDGEGKWDTILETYRQLSKGAVKKTLAPLFDQWKNEMAARSYPYFVDSPKMTDTWIHWLIEGMLDEKKGGERFHKRVSQWLSELEKDAKVFKKQWQWLTVFTRDLPNSEKIQAASPFFWETAISEHEGEDDLTVSRRKGLRRMKAGSCLPAVIEAWKKQIKGIIPDPANAERSRYTECARWAKGLLELNEEKYHALMAQWRKKHHRRRNLWRDLKAVNLPVG